MSPVARASRMSGFEKIGNWQRQNACLPTETFQALIEAEDIGFQVVRFSG
jgi:hypothetical protein